VSYSTTASAHHSENVPNGDLNPRRPGFPVQDGHIIIAKYTSRTQPHHLVNPRQAITAISMHTHPESDAWPPVRSLEAISYSVTRWIHSSESTLPSYTGDHRKWAPARMSGELLYNASRYSFQKDLLGGGRLFASLHPFRRWPGTFETSKTAYSVTRYAIAKPLPAKKSGGILNRSKYLTTTPYIRIWLVVRSFGFRWTVAQITCLFFVPEATNCLTSWLGLSGPNRYLPLLQWWVWKVSLSFLI